jgi:hypothetical protein
MRTAKSAQFVAGVAKQRARDIIAMNLTAARQLASRVQASFSSSGHRHHARTAAAGFVFAFIRVLTVKAGAENCLGAVNLEERGGPENYTEPGFRSLGYRPRIV